MTDTTKAGFQSTNEELVEKLRERCQMEGKVLLSAPTVLGDQESGRMGRAVAFSIGSTGNILLSSYRLSADVWLSEIISIRPSELANLQRDLQEDAELISR